LEGGVVRISEAKYSSKRQKIKKLRRQLNGKFSGDGDI
jgi:hypothetical protein